MVNKKIFLVVLRIIFNFIFSAQANQHKSWFEQLIKSRENRKQAFYGWKKSYEELQRTGIELEKNDKIWNECHKHWEKSRAKYEKYLPK